MKYNKNLQNKVFQEKIFKNLERNDYIKRVKNTTIRTLRVKQFSILLFYSFCRISFCSVIS